MKKESKENEKRVDKYEKQMIIEKKRGRRKPIKERNEFK